MTEERENPELPEAFLEKMRGLLGAEEFAAFQKSYEEERAQGLRLNPLKGDRESLEGYCRNAFRLREIPWCRDGFYYEQETRPGRHPLHEAGAYYIQEPSAMAVTELLDPQPGERILDLCAAPGGKTTHIAGRMMGKGLLVSNEIHPARARILSQNVERLGISNAVVTNENAGRLAQVFPEFFDRMVVDAPCSGEGMFRKDAQARGEWSEENVALCAGRQQEILDHAAAMLRPGGRMVYSTCTFSPEEDEEGVRCFLKRHPEFAVEPVACLPGLSPGRPDWAKGSCPELAHTFRIWPHQAEGEGHYMAVLKKQTGTIEERKQKPPAYWKEKAGIQMWQTFAEELFGKKDGGERLVLYGDQLYRVPEEMPDFSGLRVLRPGLHLAERKKNRLEPAHALALASSPEMVRQAVCLPPDGEEAASYLRGATLPAEHGQKGWVLVCVGRQSLGWAKASGGVLKNHYPKGLRLP